MLDKKRKKSFALKVVRLPLGQDKLLDKQVVLLMPARQVEEVLHNALVQPLPFGPDWLLGLCLWREQALPVFDLSRHYGLLEDDATANPLYLVVRVLTSEQELLRCVLRVTHQISTGDIPPQASPAAPQAGLNVLGMFTQEDKILLVPHLAPLVTAAAPLAL